jgi:hypothetical protein
MASNSNQGCRKEGNGGMFVEKMMEFSWFAIENNLDIKICISNKEKQYVGMWLYRPVLCCT